MKKRQYLLGLKAGVPVMLGFIPVGIAYALMARQGGFSVLQTCLMSLSVFAGASQMMAAGMYGQGAGMAAIILTTFILNLRHIIMSICVAERMEKASLPARFVAAFGVTDESFAIFTTVKKENCTLWFFLGIITVTYSSWNVGTLIGAVFSDLLPAVLTVALRVSGKENRSIPSSACRLRLWWCLPPCLTRCCLWLWIRDGQSLYPP